MTTLTQTIATPASIAFTGLAALANTSYVACTSAIDLGTATPIDDILELVVTPGTVANNKQALLYIQVSLDGTNYSTGPTSGTSMVDVTNLYYIGSLPLNTASGTQRKSFSILNTVGFCPRYYKAIVYNDSGAAFSAGTLTHSTIVGTIN
jgi:hypothetical protein